MRYFILAAALIAAFAPSSFAAGKAGEQAPDFPPGLFIDGRHYSLRDLEGKAVVLFFYEQDCPKCRGLIPERNKVVEQYRDKPIKFIAVAAGDSMNDARSYVTSTHLEMPVFADNLSLMEQRYGEKISLQNIYQFRVIGPSGQIQDYRMEPAALDKILSQVKWKYKDKGYHPALAQPLELLEWGRYPDGMRALRPYLKSSNKELAQSAQKLFDAIHAEGEQWLTDAEKADQSEDFVTAYDLYLKISYSFPGDDLGKKAAEPLKKLAANQAVKDELAARRMYDQLCNGAGRARPQQRQQVANFASTIAARYPKSPTGEKAAEIAREIAAAVP